MGRAGGKGSTDKLFKDAHQEQDMFKKEFGKSREQGKHREPDKIKKERQEPLGKDCRKFPEISL